MGRLVIKSRFSRVSGIGALLLGLICVPGNRGELSRIAADVEAASQSTTGPSVATGKDSLSSALTLQAELEQAGVTLGSPVYLRIFKSNGKDGAFRTIGSVQGEWEERWIPNLKRAWVELWMQGKDGSYQLVKSY